jgi:hypothetical protein
MVVEKKTHCKFEHVVTSSEKYRFSFLEIFENESYSYVIELVCCNFLLMVVVVLKIFLVFFYIARYFIF